VIVVSDTSPITNLAPIGLLHLLESLYEQVVIPQAVYDEMAGLDQVVPGAIEVQTLSWIQTQKIAGIQQAKELQQEIDLGESEAIVLALELQAELVLLDDRKARIVASRYQINVTGLLGILLEAKSKGLILAIKPAMDQLTQQANFRISRRLYLDALDAANELV
jgi:predicted nucleic acid-binding protein